MALLSRKGLLAIAAVIDVALHGRGRPVSAKALAARHALPARHLEPVLQALVRDGILKGIRGPRGGYELARERRRITADEILRAAGTIESRETEHRRLRAAQGGGDPGGGAGRAGVCDGARAESIIDELVRRAEPLQGHARRLTPIAQPAQHRTPTRSRSGLFRRDSA